MLACGDRDIYDEDAPSLYTLFQLVADVNVPTQEDPEVPACSPRTEEALQPTNIGDWSSECEQNAPLDAGSEEQDIGQEDLGSEVLQTEVRAVVLSVRAY